MRIDRHLFPWRCGGFWREMALSAAAWPFLKYGWDLWVCGGGREGGGGFLVHWRRAVAVNVNELDSNV